MTFPKKVRPIPARPARVRRRGPTPAERAREARAREAWWREHRPPPHA